MKLVFEKKKGERKKKLFQIVILDRFFVSIILDWCSVFSVVYQKGNTLAARTRGWPKKGAVGHSLHNDLTHVLFGICERFLFVNQWFFFFLPLFFFQISVSRIEGSKHEQPNKKVVHWTSTFDTLWLFLDHLCRSSFRKSCRNIGTRWSCSLKLLGGVSLNGNVLVFHSEIERHERNEKNKNKYKSK